PSLGEHAVKNLRLDSWILFLTTLATGIGIFQPVRAGTQESRQEAPRDAVLEGQTTKSVSPIRPEQRKTDHDRSAIFDARNAPSSADALKAQAKEGKATGFDFSR